MAAGELIGREAELVALDGWLAAANEGWSAMVVEGEPGIGKTALCREAIGRAEARGFVVLSCQPVEAEVKLSFAALADLLEPVEASSFEALPGLQRRALEVALLRTEAKDAPAEPRTVAAGLHGVLVGLAERTPILVAIDDTHWLDNASASALAFALRRMRDERVGLLATRRPVGRGARYGWEIAAAERLRLEPLSLAAIHELVKCRLGRSLSRPLLLRVYDTCGGNPFFGLEIAREVIHAGVAAGDPLPVPKDLRRLVRRRLGRLSPEARETLLVSAVVGEPTWALLSEALGCDPAPALEEAERAELIELAGGRVRFSHPLYAAALYAAAPRARRRLLHQRLGGISTDIEARARHLALSTDAPSAEVGALLEQAADRALARGAPAAAAELLELAIEMTPPERDADVWRRKLAAADTHFWSGALNQSGEIVQSLLAELPAGERRADVLLRLARAAEDLETVLELGEQARREAGRNDVLLARVHDLLAHGWPERGIGYALEHGRLALRHAERSGQRPLTVVVLARLSLYELWAGQSPSRLLKRAVALEAAMNDSLDSGDAAGVASWLMNVGGYASPRMPLALWQMYQGRLADARALFAALLEQADAVGDQIACRASRGRLVDVELRAGNWQQAEMHAAAVFELSEQIGLEHGGGFSVYWRALVDAHIGRLVAARAGAEVGARLAREAGERNTEVMNLGVLGFLELSLGKDAAALPHLRPVLDWLASKQLGLATHPLTPYALEALIATGELDEARKLITQFEREAHALASPWALAIAARYGALLTAAQGDVDSAATALERALTYDKDWSWPFERGRTLLLFGRVQRRAKQKAAAKQSLETALAIFERLPAPLWAERARDEIARIGLRRTSADLTENERRVAELAASGLTNREVAAQLFMSPKTVEANLARVYRKLGIHSRAELGAQLGNFSREPSQP